MTITPAQLKLYWRHRDNGGTAAQSAAKAGFSPASATNIEREQRGRELVKPKGLGRYGGDGRTKSYSQRGGLDKDPRSQGTAEENLPEPIAEADLSPEARRALEDFHYFSERYFGRVPTPWRKVAADRILQLYETDEKEFACVNVPPGSGKTTLFTHDIPAWLTMRDRGLRGVLGSWGMTTAGTYTNRLRTTFERTAVAPVSDENVKKGIELETHGILATDFGRIKPLDASAPWTANVFEVVPSDGRRSANKEPTWAAFGLGEIVGWRVNFMCFDDLVTVRKLDSVAEQERMRLWWDSEVELRIEPGGLLILEGQRLGANDHYRYVMDKVDIDDDLLDDMDVEVISIDDDGREEVKRKYHRIIYPAHDLTKCPGGDSKSEHHHPKTAKPWPEGCLLDPKRLKFRDLRRAELDNPARYATVFQQQDTDPDTVLVPKAWVDGDGASIPGCWDADRDAWELPPLAEGSWVTVVSVDPSSTKNWVLTAWAIDFSTERYVLLDLYRGALTLPEFLYGDANRSEFSGKLEEFRVNFAHIGAPLQHVIWERNAAQRWMGQLPYVRGWMRQHSIAFHEHDTHHKNKSDAEYGVTMLRPMFRHGQIRLPGKQTPHGESPKDYTGRRNAIKLVNEITTYSLQHGRSGSDDTIMSTWFMAHRARELRAVPVEEFPKLNRHLPKWMRRRAR